MQGIHGVVFENANRWFWYILPAFACIQFSII